MLTSSRYIAHTCNSCMHNSFSGHHYQGPFIYYVSTFSGLPLPPSPFPKHKLISESKQNKYVFEFLFLNSPAPYKCLRNIWKVPQEPSFKEVPNLTDKMQAAF